ncbi:YncE family protein [Hydrocarboniclastica marina]|uniref:Serine/threonine protein kinase n=1 Tax=Hydrocarboniclastica marina TaxID=2259620 RepID=A0A4P7XKC5_9ALTE|nr:serine/threonine protein kinase [Hydrocarboniclastica marina]QCF27666.1 serine/threonine protein kinase [Hydrocarboniclastica marina]
MRISKGQASGRALTRAVAITAALLLFAGSASATWWKKDPQPDPTPVPAGPSQPVIFVGNNWEGMIDVIDPVTYERLGRIDGVPDKRKRLREIYLNPLRLIMFQAIRQLIGEGNDQWVDDMYSSLDGRLLIVSRPSLADVVAIEIETGEIAWRFEVDGYRSDHMALSPDGTEVAVSASTGNVVHILDVETGQERGKFPSGDSPHENIYSSDGSKIYHASIGRVFVPLDRGQSPYLKGERVVKVVDAYTLEEIKSFDMGQKLAEAGYEGMSPAVRPMAHSPDERFFYAQVSFFHGFVEYDMQEDRVTRVAELPNLIPDVPVERYVNDSAHHGIAMNGAGDTLCVAGTMDDYVAIVDRASFEYKLLTDLGEKPYWVTTDSTGEHCYISWSETDQMSVISYATGEEVARVDVGDHPQRIREGSVPVAWTEAQ